MVVSKRAIRKFLNRKLCNSDKVKRFTEAALDEKLSRLEPVPRFFTSPRIHQKACFLLGAKYPRYLFLLDMGGGKTKVATDLFRWRRRRKEVNRMLVLVPNTSNVQQWLDELAKHAPKLTAVGLDESSREGRIEALASETDVVIITYAGWLALTCKKVKKKTKTGKLKTVMVPDERMTKERLAGFDMAVFDECDAFANSQSLTFRCCRRIAKVCKVRYGLTGTPIGRDPADFWAQFFMMDGGETLGPTKAIFQAAFFKPEEDYWSGWPKYVFDDEKKKLLYRMLKHGSVRYSDKEFSSYLPAQNYITIPVIFPKETWKYYEKLVDELKDAQGNFRLLENAYIRMRQLCSGYLTVKDPEGERVQIRFKENPKLDAMLARLKAAPRERKIIIWHEYRVTGEIICQGLKTAGYKFVWLHGKAKNKKEVIRRFLHDPKVRIIVSSSAGAKGGNWQVANYNEFFETPTSPKIRKQEEKRTHRDGQTLPCFYGDYVVKGSIEEKLIKYLKEGKDLFSALVDGKVNL